MCICEWKVLINHKDSLRTRVKFIACGLKFSIYAIILLKIFEVKLEEKLMLLNSGSQSST